ncbi:MAG TPA: efflux RND transporter periplasmic adaptor subunit [Rhizobacter sp.]|nr:efflux RND transporter periplasmic adaptor subunit [Rhizobacter sp.]
MTKKKRWLKWAVAALVLLALAAVVAKKLNARKLEKAATTASKATQGFDLSPSDVVVLQPQELVRTLSVSGGLRAVNSAFIKAKVAAEVKSLTVREGDKVTAGQLIGQLDTSELEMRLRQAEQTAGTSKAQLDIANRTLENNRALVAQGFISATGLETSISNSAAAQSTYGAAVAAVDLTRKALADARLIAPISGLVSQRLVQVGERVSIDTKLVEIVDLSRIELEAAMAPEDVVDVNVGQTARLQVDGFSEPALATVARINPSAQTGTRAVMVYLALAPHPGLRQGLFAKGSIELQRRSTLVAPVSAVRVDQARPYVLTVAEGKVVPKTVSLGARGEATLNAGRESVVEITEGVAPGTTLLRGVVGQLREGTPVNLAASASMPASSVR